MSFNRLQSIDQLRGLVMLLMLVDHVRERFYLHLQVSDPMDLSQTENALALTRMLAHFCAPIFVFLTGLSAWLYAQKHSSQQLTHFLIKRGVVLLLLEVTLVNVAWLGTYQTLYLQVIWVLGLCMLVLAVLHHLPRALLWVLALTLMVGHNVLTPIQFSPGEWGYSLWTILHDRGYLVAPGQDVIAVKISYPLLPWIGVIVLGYLAGNLFKPSTTSAQPLLNNDLARTRQRLLRRLGIGALLVLVILRATNVYGETLSWQRFACNSLTNLGAATGDAGFWLNGVWLSSFWSDGCWQSGLQTLLSFFNFPKYPPSLDFLLLTLGAMALLLAALESLARSAWFQSVGTVLANFGAAPMFFYLLHLYALLLMYSVAVHVFGVNKGNYVGVDAVWQLWLLALLLASALYLPTRWFARFKQRSHAAWVRYL